MQVWNVLHATRWKYRTQKWRKNRHLGTIPQLCRAISSQLRHISTIGKKLISSNISSTCLHNTVNFGPLAAEIISGVWGTPSTFNGFRVLAALLRTACSSGRQPNFVALNRGRHLCLVGRPSRWALAHVSSCVNILLNNDDGDINGCTDYEIDTYLFVYVKIYLDHLLMTLVSLILLLIGATFGR